MKKKIDIVMEKLEWPIVIGMVILSFAFLIFAISLMIGFTAIILSVFGIITLPGM